MNDLLIELFTEDVPARLHKQATINAQKVFSNLLVKSSAEFQNVKAYISPRRLAIHVTGLSEQTRSITEVKRGPRIDANEKALNGFLSSNSKSISDLVEKEGYYYLSIENKGCNITEIIPNLIEDLIINMPWPKSMHWYLEKEKKLSAFWIRPIRSVMCIYNGNPLEFYIESIGLTTGNRTYGHRFLGNKELVIQNFEDYVKQLEDNKVMHDFGTKRAYIENELAQQVASMGLIVKSDDALLDEVTGLVEYPFIHIGHIEEQFMSLPVEILSTSMKVHQKYFTLTYPDSNIAPFFATVTNVPCTGTMAQGFERVLKARLSDAMFFYKEDTDVTLEAYSNRLSNVVFHEKLGSVAQKVDRLMSIANSTEEHRVIALCKADLVSQMVGEFPELQGIMGTIYARVQGESDVICEAICEHYKPLGATDNLPKTYVGSRISFFDKLDTLVGFLGVGIKPTGSKDPFALRRAAVSIIRLICDSTHNILEDSLEWYIDTLISAYADQGIVLVQSVKKDVITFLKDRLVVYVSDSENIDSNLCWQVVENSNSDEYDFKIIKSKIIKINELSKKPEFEIVRQAYKRACGIVGDFQPVTTNKEYVYENEYMKILQSKLSKLSSNDSEIDFNNCVDVSHAILNACENVLMNDDNLDVKNSNMALLQRCITTIENQYGKL